MKKELSARISIIDKDLDKFLSPNKYSEPTIYEAMRYSVFAGGKRLRPILMWEIARLFGKGWNDVKEFACAIEMIHTYSLIHDDLPAMDNDDFRRGMPTNHIKFGEDIAILAGDALLNKAFETALKSESENVICSLRELANASGAEGMIGGQVIDLQSEGKDVDVDTLRFIHSLKTGALIRAACVVGAILSNADMSDIGLIDNFAINLGIAFQIQDDILDVMGTQEELGKPIGSDKEQEKNTYVSILGVATAKKLVVTYSNRAKKALEKFGDKADFLIKLTNYLAKRKN